MYKLNMILQHDRINDIDLDDRSGKACIGVPLAKRFYASTKNQNA
jgi:hypothetical protein